jgi:hypothetical protein
VTLKAAMLLAVALVGAPDVDEDYEPVVGDRVIIYTVTEKKEASAWCATTASGYRDNVKCLHILDDAGMVELERSGQVGQLKSRTQVLILDVDEEPVMVGKNKVPSTCVEIRILSGPAKGKRLYTPDYHVARLKPQPSER